MKHGWLIHQHLLDENSIPKTLIDALQVSDVPVVVRDIDLINQTLSEPLPPEVELWSSLGTIAFQRNAHNLRDFQGVEHYSFFAPELHQYSRYQHMIPRELILNRNGLLLPFSECFHRTAGSLATMLNTERVHVRPDNSLKLAEAEQFHLTETHWQRFLQNTKRLSGANPQSLFWLFPAVDIREEYRMVVYQNEIIAATPYPHNIHDLSQIATSVPDIAISVAQEAAKSIHISDQIYVLDVARTSENQYYVIELNCMATSGWYELDPQPIAKALNHAIEHVIQDLYV